MRKRIAISFLVSTILVGMFAGISVTATEVQNSEVLIENEPTMEEPEVLIEEEILFCSIRRISFWQDGRRWSTSGR